MSQCKFGEQAAVAAAVVTLTLFVFGVTVPRLTGQALPRDVTTQTDWILLYAEDFSTPLNGALAP